MTYDYDKDKIKSAITQTQMMDFLSELGGEPFISNGAIVSKTICHHPLNELDEAGHKLYYYENTHLCRCYTGCPEGTFDIFSLVQKIKTMETGEEYPLPQAIEYVAQYFGFSKELPSFDENDITSIEDDLKYLENSDRIKNIELNVQRVEIKKYDDSFLKNFPNPIIQSWIDDGISKEIMDYYEIRYDPKNHGVIIPHRDINGRLIGVRERILIKEEAEKYGKYLPYKRGRKMYNHPLSFNLYGLFQNQDNIKLAKKAIIVESEKAVLQYATMFGQENNIALAICGSNFINYQAWLLIQLGVKEIIIALDRQYQELGDNEHKKLVRNLKNIHKKYGQFVTISIIFDKKKILKYKESPTDGGKEKFLQLLKERINIYD